MEIEGILNINKEQDMTSHDVVGRVRRILSMKRVGHTGTLDPMATGVLPVCVGKATRIVEYLDLDTKRYLCTMVLGREMDTQDIWGTEVARADETKVNAITESDVDAAFAGFHSMIEQTPPMYSAVKIDGKRLYEYARAGKEVEVKSRQVYIPDLTIEEMSLGRGFDSSVTFSVECTKGTYIRSICHEAGKNMGVNGAMSALVRTGSGIFDIEHSVTLGELKEMSEDEIRSIVSPTPAPLMHFGEVLTNETGAITLLNGLPLYVADCEVTREPEYAAKDFYFPIRDEYRRAYLVFARINNEDKTFIGIAFKDKAGESLVPEKIFYSRG